MTTQATKEPESFVAGDTVKWKKCLASYKASDGWQLAYAIVGASAININASADGDDHLVTITAASSGAYAAGTYKWIATVTKDDERYTVGEGYFDIKPNLANATTYTDDVLRLKKDIAAIDAFLGKNFKYASYSINGRTLTNYGMADLFTLRDRLQRQLNSLLDVEKIKSGKPTRKLIRVRFNQ